VSVAPVVEVIIGLVFLYMVLSVIVSGITEGISGLFGWRSEYLERGIKSLLGSALAGDFYKHDLIRSLSNVNARLVFNRRPSYVSASTFTETVLDVTAKLEPPAQADPPVRGTVVPSNDAALEGLRDLLRVQASAPDAPVLPVLRLFSDAAKDLDDFKKRVDRWYEEAMDRVGGWYKRFTRSIMLVVGIALVLLLNADSINIATTLWREAPIRDAAVDLAGAATTEAQPSPDEAAAELRSLEELNLPLGWVTRADAPGDPRRWPTDFDDYVIKIFGLLLTAFALTFGATFWFDLLKRFVGIRSSGAEPQPAQTGPPSGAAEQPQRLEIGVASGPPET
jgi:hypothetical protein